MIPGGAIGCRILLRQPYRKNHKKEKFKKKSALNFTENHFRALEYVLLVKRRSVMCRMAGYIMWYGGGVGSKTSKNHIFNDVRARSRRG